MGERAVIHRGVGASMVRKEDDRHLRGRGQFVADIALRGTQEVVFLRSPHAHATISSISVPPAARGKIFTAADLPRIKPRPNRNCWHRFPAGIITNAVSLYLVFSPTLRNTVGPEE